MNGDLLDRAFLQAAAGQGPRGFPTTDAQGGIIPAALDAGADQTAADGKPPVATATGAEMSDGSGEAAAAAVDQTLLELLERFPEQWAAVALAVEQASRAGTRVIAVAGHQQGEGRTTLVRGLGLLLSERGWQVTSFPSAAAWWQELVGAGPGWQPLHTKTAADNDIVLVDAGIWFPPGPLRPRQLLLKMFGFDGVLLMRHHAHASCPARDGAIAKAGLKSIGEIVSFAPALTQRAA